MPGNNHNIKLERVLRFPKELIPGILYVSDKFSTSAHLCPCGCGNRIIIPIGAMNWTLKVKRGKPSLYPSLGNWELPCRSHYWIRNGQIVWSDQWTDNEINAGRKAEELKRQNYYQKKPGRIRRFIGLLFGILKRFFGKW